MSHVVAHFMRKINADNQSVISSKLSTTCEACISYILCIWIDIEKVASHIISLLIRKKHC